MNSSARSLLPVRAILSKVSPYSDSLRDLENPVSPVASIPHETGLVPTWEPSLEMPDHLLAHVAFAQEAQGLGN
jgi:hypothetical protein